MKIKNWKTTAIGIIGTFMIIFAMILVYFGKATLTEVTTFGGSLGLILTTLLGFMAKDFNKTGV